MDDICGEVFESVCDAAGECIGGSPSGPGPFPWIVLALAVAVGLGVAYYHDAHHARPRVPPAAAPVVRPLATPPPI